MRNNPKTSPVRKPYPFPFPFPNSGHLVYEYVYRFAVYVYG